MFEALNIFIREDCVSLCRPERPFPGASTAAASLGVEGAARALRGDPPTDMQRPPSLSAPPPSLAPPPHHAIG